MHDAVAFEQRGIPALPVLTDVFVSEARRKAGYLSFPDLPLVVVDHPFSALTPEQIRGRAVQALPQVVAGLTGRGQQGGR